MADPRAPKDNFGPLIDTMNQIKSRLQTLETASGTQRVNLRDEVMKLFDDLSAQVQQQISVNSYTRAEIDNKVTNPGNINPANVNASGIITAGQTANNLINNFRTVVLGDDGSYGISASSARYKEDITPYQITDEQFRAGAPDDFRYIGSSQVHTGFIAEKFVAAGLTEPVFYDVEGLPEGMNYQQAVPYVWAQVIKVMDRQDDFDRRLSALENGV